MKKIDVIEILSIAGCLMFAIVISLYHVSFDGYLGLSSKSWGAIWAIAENGFSIFLCLLVGVYSYGVIQKIFRYVMVPYFALKLIYHFSCFSGIYLLPAKAWEQVWSYSLVMLIIIALGYCYYLIKNRNVA